VVLGGHIMTARARRARRCNIMFLGTMNAFGHPQDPAGGGSRVDGGGGQTRGHCQHALLNAADMCVAYLTLHAHRSPSVALDSSMVVAANNTGTALSYIDAFAFSNVLLTICRSLSVALDGSMVVAANNAGTAYVWRMLRGASVTTHFEPLHKLRAHQGGLLMSKSS